MAAYRGSRGNDERHTHAHCISEWLRGRNSTQMVRTHMFKSFVLQFVHLLIVTLTYSLANIQSRPSLLNCLVPWVYSQTCIRSRSMSVQVPDDDDLLVKIFNTVSNPQIRNVFVMYFSVSLLCILPTGTHVGFTWHWSMSRSCLHTTLGNCPHSGSISRLRWTFWRLGAYKHTNLWLFFSPLQSQSPSHLHTPKLSTTLSIAFHTSTASIYFF